MGGPAVFLRPRGAGMGVHVVKGCSRLRQAGAPGAGSAVKTVSEIMLHRIGQRLDNQWADCWDEGFKTLSASFG